jgi:DNA modification methylase
MSFSADQIVVRRVEELMPYARNARTHSDNQVEQLAQSIREFGFTNPVLVDGDGGIIAGHGRVMAAKKLGMDTVPTIRVDWLNDAQRRAYILADNKLALNAGWDESMLAQELDELRVDGFDLGMTGFSTREIDELLASLDGEHVGMTEDDAVPEVQAEAISQPGDIWHLGDHVLMCGDSTDLEHVKTLLGAAGLADMVFTDPPYGVNYSGKGSVHESHVRAAALKGAPAKTKHRPIANDALNDEQQLNFWRDAFISVASAIKPGSAYYICSPQGGRMMMMMMQAMAEAGIPQRHEIIWRKNTFSLGRADYHYQHEPILYGWKEGAGHAWYGGRDQTSVWDFPKPQKSDLHPTMKPVDLIEKALRNSSKAGDMILDLFGGSGSTMIASEKTNRLCRMMELDRHYCDVIVRRWQEFTGRRAVHALTSQPFPA